MKRKHATIGTIGLTLLLLAGCGGAGGGDPMNVAEQFMDRYYNKASVEEAKAVTIPAVAEKIAEKVASPADAATGGREVSYTLKEKNREGKHAYVVYETTITSKEAGTVIKEVYLSIDVVDGAWKVTQFEERPAGTAVPGQS